MSISVVYGTGTCLRCKIAEGFSRRTSDSYGTVDFKADAQTFNTFIAPTARPSTATSRAWNSRCSTTARRIKQGSAKSSPICCPVMRLKAR